MFRQWLGAHKSLVATATSGTVIAALVTTAAIVSSGYTAQRLDLGDGSVWVSNGTEQVIGRANTQVLELNTVVTSTGSNIDVVQQDATVLLFDHTNNKVDIVDPATSKVLDSVPLPPDDPQVFLAGDNVVIGSVGTGQVWITPAAQLASFNSQSQPTLSLGADTVMNVAPDGTLVAYSQAAKTVYTVNAATTDSVESSSKLSAGTSQSRFSITSVGGQWALFDSASSTLYTAAGSTKLADRIGAASTAVLQKPEQGGSDVLIATSTGLISTPVGGGSVTTLASGRSGFPAAPLVTGDCVYAAWSGGTAYRQCGSASARSLTLDGVPVSSTRLTFALNGNRVVLNDPRAGGTWAVQQNGELIDNWGDLITVRNDQQQSEENQEDTPPTYETTQLPPVAVDDAFGARPGRTSVLPVLLNDYDPNGDVLVISDFTAINPSIGKLDIINNAQQLQITLSATASGTVTFPYSISDGRGGTATANVVVTVRTPDQNSPPVQVRSSKALVVAGGRVTTSVLGDWVDPDGDAFYLSSATTAAPDSVSYKPEGSVVYTEGGASGTVRSVVLVVSDGKAAGTGSLAVTVRSSGQVPIITDPFVVLAYSGQPITASPLVHVRGGSGTIRLVSVPAKTGATITASLEAGTFVFSSTQIGTHYLDYVVTDGDLTATGQVRVDVAAPPDANTKPITIPKTVFVQSLSSQTIDVASTDIDPGGGVLLVTGVYNVAQNSGVRAEVIEQRAIRVTLTAPLDSGPVSFNYRVSNGLAEAEGIVTVIEIPVPARLQPPIANDDSVTVRVGDAINIPVLDNDVQPDGEALTLDPLLSTNLGGESGLLFASGNQLRYLAPQKTGDFTAVYSVSGPDGQKASAQVKIAVREPVLATNNPPVPVAVTSRVLAGETVRITIPLAGIDPDGDSVQLLGQATSPDKGSVVDTGTDFFDYQAGDYSAGTDSFTYTVVDSLGARAIGTVRVGISPKLDGARNPVAVEDDVTMRPGGTVSVQPLQNDSDPDGSTLKIKSVEPNQKDMTATVEGDIVRITPPAAVGRYAVVYTIENAFGGTSSNFITVTVETNAARAYPVVSDSVLTLTDILGRDSINVNVLNNVFFADGAVSSLKVSILPGFASSASVTATKRVHVTVENKSQIIPFAVANPDDPSIVSYAFVWVPGLDDALPQLNRKAPALSVPSESTLTIDLDDYVLAVGGKQIHLTDTASVQATHSNGDDLVVNDHTLRFTSADKYFGPASISFEVTDGSSANDPNGHTATLVLPIKVTARANQPPVFIGGVIDFEPSESKTIDLTKLTNYNYPDDLSELVYAVSSPLPTNFTYSLTGQTLTIKADADAARSSTTAIVLGVADSVSTGQAGRIQLNVVSSTKPLAQAAADSVAVQRGQTASVDVLANDQATNPFPGQPLKVVAIRGLEGSSVPAGLTITPNADNSKLMVSVAADAVPGDTTLQYEIEDATGDPTRGVWGPITISVQDRPDPVTSVRATAFDDRVVTLRWVAGAPNNSPITGYQVQSVTTSGVLLSTTACPTAVCDVPTAGNGPSNAVVFTVLAVNALGTSDPTPIGSAVWSDIIPGVPSTISASPLDGGLVVNWSAVPQPSGGSAVNLYHVTAGASSIDIDPSTACNGSSCNVSLTGLQNGQTVPVTVSAHNSAYAALASWNTGTGSGTPAGPPLAVAAPNAVATNNSISLDWSGSFDGNGRTITSYTAAAFTGATPTCDNPDAGGATTHTTGGTSTTFSGLSNEVDYSLIVFATNSQGCTASSAVTAHTSPGVITAASTSGPSANGSVFDFALAAASIGNTALGSDYTIYYQLVGGAAGSVHGPISVGDFLTAEALQYGNDMSVQLRACRAYPNSGTICQSQWSQPFHLGTPVDPTASGVQFVSNADGVSNNGVFSWTGAPGFAGSTYTKVEVACGDGVGDQFVDTAQGSAGSCAASASIVRSPVLTFRVTANNGRTYLSHYDSAGNLQ